MLQACAGFGILVLPILVFSIIIASFISHPTYAAEASSSIGLAITPANLAITAPASGGLTTGKQSIKLTSNSNYQTNYNLSLSSKDTNTSLLPTKTGNTTKLLTTTGTLTKPATTLNNNEWGIILDGKSYIGSPSSDTNPLQLMNGTLNNSSNNSNTGNTANTTATKDITFATKTTEATPADTYTISLVYTITAEEILPAPTVDRTTPAAYQYGDTTNTKWTTSANGAPTTFNAKTITIQGGNFVPDATSVYLDINNNGKEDDNELCANVTVDDNGDMEDDSLTCTIPDETTNKALDTTKDAVYNLVVSNGSQSTTKKNAFAYYTSSICENANPNSDCQVDIDANMIPVKYTGNTTNPEWVIADIDKQGDWYNYETKQWANAVTMNPTNLAKYKDSPAGTVIPEDAILSYFTYIPRYAYEVMRPNATDKFVYDQNFAIKFEKATDIKKTPASTCNILNPTVKQMWKDGDPNNNTYANVLAKDYRQDCNIDRIYPTTTAKANQTTWATHPAFTWTDGTTANTKELNGIWVGKYETSGSTTQPTIKPNKWHIAFANYIEGKQANSGIGYYYDVAKSVGVEDKNNVGGNGVAVKHNNNNLNSSVSHMLKNSEWGAVIYLTMSKYGASMNLRANNAIDAGGDGNSQSSYGQTGCGPKDNDKNETYNCAGDVTHQYQSTIGQLASTTGNPTGIYDMSGGAFEYVMGNMSNSNTTNSGSTANQYQYTFINPTSAPYVDIYPYNLFKDLADWAPNSNMTDSCDDLTCLGQAIHETASAQMIDYHYTRNASSTWGGGSNYFEAHIDNRPWYYRGSTAWSGNAAGGQFEIYHGDGYTNGTSSFRVGLLPLFIPQ